MSTAEQRRKLFDGTIKKLGLSQGHVAKWMSLKDTKQTRENVSRKVRGSVGTTAKDVALIQMLDLLSEFYELKTVKFSEDGEITHLERK
ncbi:hypothetical protein [Microbulbifer epialgicus]|uniref:Transcriptional regulator n=1 Tax=Microbulbifer epialgicus TaxID=393907 RepID=A0ABV4NTJ1_9GAMM